MIRRPPLWWDAREYSRAVRIYESIRNHGANYVQSRFRFRNDNGSQTTATWMAALDTNPTTIQVGNKFRLRFVIANTGDATGGDASLAIQYRINTGGGFGSWITLTTSTSVVRAYDSSNLTDNEATTQQIGAGTFNAEDYSTCIEDGTQSGAGGDNEVTAGQEAEPEFTVEIVAGGSAAGNVIEFRMVRGGAALAAYTVTPSITLASAVSSLIYDPRRSFQHMLLR